MKHGKPANYLELVAYLGAHPFLRSVSPPLPPVRQSETITELRFTNATHVSLVFRTDTQTETTVGVPDHRAHVAFHRDRFEVKAGAAVVRYYYLDKPTIDPSVFVGESPPVHTRGQELFVSAIGSLTATYPVLNDADVVAELAGGLQVPDTGDVERDYRTVRDQLEKMVRTQFDHHAPSA
jgi:hypothetical protein